MKKIIDTRELTHEQWLEYRQRGIGGSDAGAICGMNPYMSAIDVYMAKTNPIEYEEPNEAMRLGTDLEEYVAKRWEESTGKKVRRNYWMMADDEQPYMLANIDREVVGENAILECKTASPYSADKWKNDEIPPHYLIQCMHYMAITGADRCYLACLIFGRGIELRTIERDEETIMAIRTLEREFWEDHVVKGEMPPPDGSKAADGAIKTLYPDSTEEEITLHGFDNRLDRLAEIEDLSKKLSEEAEKIKQEIKVEMEEADTAYASHYKITWKSSKPRESVDSKKLKKKYPEIWDKCKKVGAPVRTFKIKNLEEM